jgi:hypothetical protein
LPLAGLVTPAAAQTGSIVDLGRADGVGTMAINDSGQIVGLGTVDDEGQTPAFLLTPMVREPPLWLPMGLGAVGLALRRLGWHGTPAAG